jgi:hypothetical protein
MMNLNSVEQEDWLILSYPKNKKNAIIEHSAKIRQKHIRDLKGKKIKKQIKEIKK